MGINVSTESNGISENITNVPSNTAMGINVSTENTVQQLNNKETVCSDIMCSDAIMAPLDPYLDARLSGALEQLNASEMTALNTLANMGLLQPPAIDSSSNEIGVACSVAVNDHTYCQTNSSDKPLINTVQNETRLLCEILIEASPEAVEPYVCEVDMSAHDMFNNLDYYSTNTVLEGEPVLGINNDVDTDQYTVQTTAKPDVGNVKGINTSTQPITVTVMGSNIVEMVAETQDFDPYDTDDTTIYDIEPSESDFEGFTPDDLPPADPVPIYDSQENPKTITKLNQETDIDSQLTSSDSDFEGFTEQDLYQSVPLYETWDSSSFTDSSSGSSGASVEENSETNIASEKTIGSVTVYPIGIIEKMWKKDAITKNWTVPVEKMNKKKVYELSNRPPDWDKIDPYSDLEEMDSNHQINEDGDRDQVLKTPEQRMDSADHVKTIQNKYHLQEHKPVNGLASFRKSKRDTPAVTYTENDSNSGDSDFSLHPKRQRNRNVGLREPSRSRLHAQEIITATNVNKNPNSDKTFPVRATEQSKDKCCPYCDEMFYYLSGVQTHITHTHSNIVSMKGMTDPNVMGENGPSMMGINVNGTDSKMGINKVKTPSTSTLGANVEDAKVPSVQPGIPLRSEQNNSFSHHKKRPKYRGKHYRPKPKPEPSTSDETLTESKKKDI